MSWKYEVTGNVWRYVVGGNDWAFEVTGNDWYYIVTEKPIGEEFEHGLKTKAGGFLLSKDGQVLLTKQ